ncbi:hypothetical protein [Carboxylicivirga caseinilyticus]|uniref:hypothetical protein n=1 Tax=Carboxylicivirga caseinilyticus TaxID=3417572 RepID=UPI003D34694C|nr:hypothetical protein [Marinilabiliaceae bacterium A049]
MKNKKVFLAIIIFSTIGFIYCYHVKYIKVFNQVTNTVGGSYITRGQNLGEYKEQVAAFAELAKQPGWMGVSEMPAELKKLNLINTFSIGGMVLTCFLFFFGLIKYFGKPSVLPKKPEPVIVTNEENEPIEPIKPTEPIDNVEGRTNISDSKLTTLNNLLVQEKKRILGKSKKQDIVDLMDEVISNKVMALQFLDKYKTMFKTDLIKDLEQLSSSYDGKKEYLRLFIEHEIIDKNYPHDYL